MKKIILVAASLAMFSTPAFAAPGNTSSDDGAATAEVVSPLTLTHDAGAVLNFGKFTAGTTGGTVVVTQAGAGSATGDVTLMADSAESADAFTVEGGADRTFTISGVDDTVDLGTTASMSFTLDIPSSGTLDTNGDATFDVGGTLTVGANQAPGVYNGTYAVTVTYN